MNIFKRLLTGRINEDNNNWDLITSMGGANGYPRTKQLLDEYRGIVYACITAIADSMTSYEPVVYRKMGREYEPIYNHELNAILDNNPNISLADLISYTQSYIEITGEAFWYLPYGERTRKPKEVILLDPTQMEVHINDKTGEILGYSFNRQDGFQVPFEVDEILHIKTFNPYNKYRGLGTVDAGLLYIQTEYETSVFQNSFMRNQATPSGVLTVNGKGNGVSTKKAWELIKRTFKENYSGAGNAGKTFIIRDGELSFEKLGLSLADIDLEQLNGVTFDKVRRMFKVPKPMLGDTDASGLGRANVDAIEYIFMKRVINPKMDRIDGYLTKLVQKYWGADLLVEHEPVVPEDESFKLLNYEKGVDKWITRNEIRQELGKDPIEGGDKLFIENTKSELDNIDDVDNDEMNRSFKKKQISDSQFSDNLEKIEDKYRLQYRKNLNKLLKEQQRLVIDQVSALFGKKGLKQKQTVQYLSGAFSIAFGVEDLELNFLAVLLSAIRESGVESLDYLGLPDEEFLINQNQRLAVFNSTERLMKSFNKETAEAIQKQVAIALEDGFTIEELTRSIEAVYSDARGYRAERIALTEVHKATNEGVSEAFKQQGIRQLKWLAKPDACEFCKALDGTVKEIDQPFIANGDTVTGSDGGSFVIDYTDVMYADLHPNCRCRLVPA